jgi:uncharacterized protein
MKWKLPILAALAAWSGSQFVAAQDFSSPASGITVSATGEANVKPNKMEIEIKTSVSAELTGDAVVKYRDAISRAKDIVGKLKIDNLRVIDEGVVVSSSGVGASNGGGQMVVNGGFAVAQNGNAGNTIKQEVGISKSWKLAISGIDKLSEEEVIALTAKLLDAVKDAGLAVFSPNNNGENEPDGQPLPSAVVLFVADNIAIARKQATAQAFQHAQEKAQHIAELTGGQLGSANAVEESSDTDTNDTVNAAPGNLPISSDNSAEPRASAFALAELPVRVNLRVRFALQPNTTPTSNGTAK